MTDCPEDLFFANCDVCGISTQLAIFKDMIVCAMHYDHIKNNDYVFYIHFFS